ncbi:hypothetical protein HJ590_08275 [Naumannella sp. ID2617S]|nr:hypothetical protein [Naumannella sp. ID2617S]
MSNDQVMDGLDQLRQALAQAKGVPMSASCMVNRSQLLDLIEQVRAALPEELAQANQVLADSDAQRDQVLARAQARADELASEHEITRVAREQAERLRRDTEQECAALRRETDVFIDSRLASFESVLHKTSSQVATARQRLSERSGLDAEHVEPLPSHD